MCVADLYPGLTFEDGPDILAAVLGLRDRLTESVERLRDRCVGLDNDDLDLDAAFYELDAEIEEAITDMRMELSV